MIGLADRAVSVGKTGSGKSETMLALWARSERQRVLVDVADHYELGPAALEEGALDVDRVGDLDWRVRTLRFVPSGSQRQYDDLFAAIFDRGDLDVLLDELYGPTSAAGSPPWLRRTVTQGRKRRIRFLATTQRPAHVLPEAIDQAEHAYIFPLVRRDDLAKLSDRTGVEPKELAAALRGLDRVEGLETAEPTGYLYHRIGRPELVRMPPLPPDLIEQTRRHVVNPS
jgi:hypothetical protein